MIAFEVHLNGTKLTTAGGEDVELLLAIIRWCRDAEGEEADIDICGQRGNVHLIWKDVKLKRGDEILLRIVDVGDVDVDPPAESLIP